MNALAQRFGAGYTAGKVLHRGQGIVTEIAGSAQPLVLKVIASLVEITSTVQARLDWINYLHENGQRVLQLVISAQGQFVEQVEIAGGVYAAYASAQMPLTAKTTIDWRDASMRVKLGRVMGAMHRLARAYHPRRDGPLMGQWDEVDWLQHPRRVLHPSQSAIVERIVALRDTIAQFPRNAANYGLIHDDLHTGNVFYLDDDLAVLDFDCCHYGWFAADIASALLFRVWIGPQKESPEVREQAVTFLRDVIRGYKAESDLPPGWLAMMPHFLKLREISLYQSFFRHMDASSGEGNGLFRYLFTSIAEGRTFLEVDLWR